MSERQGADYFAEEERRRTERYRRDTAVETTLAEMNRILADAELPTGAAQEHPTVLVFGLPRSGTTLLYQLLCYSLDVGYVNNITARFWDAPRYGVALSSALLGASRDDSFASTYGRTPGLAGPHEFRFFWQRWLGLETMEDHLDFGPSYRRPDWPGLRQALADLQRAFDRPLVFKSLYFGQFVPGLLESIDAPLLVYVDRSPRDVALSILAARKAYYHDPSVWWSSFPPNYRELEGLPFPEQIARQVVSLRAFYDERVAAVDPRVVLRVTYDDLCASPRSIVDDVREKVRASWGADITVVNDPPAAFTERRTPEVDADGRAVLAALDQLDA